MKKFSIFLLSVLLMIPILISAQTTPASPPADKKTEAAPEPKAEDDSETSVLNDQVYREITLEDFETATYNSSIISVKVTKDQKAELQIRDQYPAPVKGSKKYIGIKIYGKQGDYTTITFPKPLVIKDYCQSISVWVYGKKFAGELSLIISDAEDKIHRLSLDKLNFLGWRKLTVRLSKDVTQEDRYLAQQRYVKVMKIVYNPGSTERLPQWNYFYIDDISAKVREKYKDMQSDEW